jgi:hypothetical protein
MFFPPDIMFGWHRTSPTIHKIFHYMELPHHKHGSSLFGPYKTDPPLRTQVLRVSSVPVDVNVHQYWATHLNNVLEFIKYKQNSSIQCQIFCSVY